jgi:HPt (histidine-containing phosphotransfer) domain-containing protein
MYVAAISGEILIDRPERPWVRAGDGLPPVDLVHLARQTDGDESLEAELLAIFDRQAEKLAERVKLADLPRRARADIAHTLRGSALAIGAFEVARVAEAVEAAFTGEGGEPEAEIAALRAAVARARGAIADFFG